MIGQHFLLNHVVGVCAFDRQALLADPCSCSVGAIGRPPLPGNAARARLDNSSNAFSDCCRIKPRSGSALDLIGQHSVNNHGSNVLKLCGQHFLLNLVAAVCVRLIGKHCSQNLVVAVGAISRPPLLANPGASECGPGPASTPRSTTVLPADGAEGLSVVLLPADGAEGVHEPAKRSSALKAGGSWQQRQCIGWQHLGATRCGWPHCPGNHQCIQGSSGRGVCITGPEGIGGTMHSAPLGACPGNSINALSGSLAEGFASQN